MADHSDRPSDDWGNTVGKWTFILTVILTVLYVGAVILYVR
jgi:hypothetical protein